MESSTQRPIIIISLITAACLIGDSMLYVALPTHWQEMGLTSLWQIGIILSVNRLVRLPLNPLVGWLYKKISARSGMLFSVILAAVTTTGYGLVHSFGAFIVLRCLWGLAWTFFRLGAYFTILAYATDQNRGKCMGLYNGLYRLGSLVGMLLGGILADTLGPMWTALFFGTISLCSLPFVCKYVQKSARGMVAEAAQTEKQYSLLQHLHVVTVLVVGALFALIYQGMFNATLSYLIKAHNPEAVHLAGFIIGAASLGGIVQAIRWAWEPWLAPWFGHLTDGSSGRYPLLLLSTLVAAVCFALLARDLNIWLWLGLILVLQLTATSLTTIADALAADAACGAAKVKIMTLYSLLIDLGSAIGPMLAYFANQYVHTFASCYLAAFIMLAITLKYLPALRRH